ncbi:dihydrofolate reductase family protein [Brevibacterium yomogidense]|uniref:dihydrofolate reductase family protein n=1 Tax=Brevibacterium yomogidense TaxID=946573 RepID=UPI0018DFD056|nr:dihydrofolate reductase family protein [Brevibacterium yomogidense]
MGRLVYSMNVSADGFVEDADGEFRWSEPDEEVLAAINEATARAGTYLYGRRIYELMHVWETDPGAAGQSPESAEFATIWQQADKVVYSTTLDNVWTRNTQLRRAFDPDEVRAIVEAADGDVTIEGPTLAAHALRHGLVDVAHYWVHPIAVGGGLRFWPDVKLDLTLQRARSFASGVVELVYAL